MNNRGLWILLVLFAALIFGANYHAARNGSLAQDCVKCNCTVKMKFPDYGRGKEPSCSVIFTKYFPPESSFEKIIRIEPLGKDEVPFEECDTTVMCDKGSEAELSCTNQEVGEDMAPTRTTVFTDQKCSIRCEQRGDITRSHMIQCDARKRAAPKKKKTAKPRDDEFGILSFGTSAQRGPSEFVSSAFGDGQTQDEGADEIVTETALWRPIEGESGIDEGVLSASDGTVEARSFCTGDETRLTGPGAITLPRCQIDTLGSWRGAYARRHPKGTFTTVPINLDIRKDGRYIGGDLTTRDGTFKITSYSQTSSSITLKATGTVEGKQVDLVLNGEPGKGELVFDGREGTPGQISTRIVGFVRRLYIADSGLPTAVAGQPFNFKLVASTPFRSSVTFALAEGRLPRGISLDASSGTLTGTPSETGKFNIRVSITDTVGGSFAQPFTLEVKKMALVARWLPDAVIGQPYAATLKVLGGRPPYKFTGGVTTGLTLDPATGEISGTPTRPSSTIYSVFFTDSQNTYDGDLLRLVVRGTTITNSHYLPNARKGVPVRVQFKAIGNTLPINWYVSGNVLPMTQSGMSINPQTGELTGAPNKTGTFVFSVTARGGESQTRTFSMTVLP